MADDELADYRSEEDEDYVPDDDDVDEAGRIEEDGQPSARGKAMGRSRGKKRKGAPELLSRTRRPLDSARAKKGRGGSRVGAAVLSDDDEELLYHLPPPTQPPSAPAPAPVLLISTPTGSTSNPPCLTEDAIDGQVVEAAVASTADASGEAVHPVAHTSSTTHSTTSAAPPDPPPTAPSSPAATPAPHRPPAAPLPAPPATVSAAAAAPRKGDDLASILAAFNRKTAKPAVRKVINPWELPLKTKPATTSHSTPHTSSPTPPVASSLSAAQPLSTSLPPSATEDPRQQRAESDVVEPLAPAPAAPSATSPPPPAADAPLSTEQVVVTEYTSYAGEALAVKKVMIRGSAEEVAHRAAKQDNLAHIVSSLTAKRAINTLEKSRLDWSVSKAVEGDEEQLRAFVGSKDALVERMAFLAKADQRQWEKQKEARDEARKQTATKSTAGMDEN